MSKDAIFEKNNMLSDYINKISFGEDFQKTSQEKHSTIYPLLADGDAFERREHSNLSNKQQMRLNASRYSLIHKIFNKHKLPPRWFTDSDINFQLVGLPLNTIAFFVTISLLGDQQQSKYWLDLIYQGKIVGAYGQTQLGHGSNVQGIQTKAQYDQKTDSFIINSPSVTSSKFWPGVLGVYSTHTVLQAQCFVKGKNIGVQTFVIQIRDHNLQPLPGVTAGDIGSKLGFMRVDNGYLSLTGYRTARKNMLMRYIKVEKGGQVKGLENKQAIKYGYGSMLNLRVRLVLGFSLGFILRPAIELHNISSSCSISGQHLKQLKTAVINYACTGYGFVIANRYTQTMFQSFIKQLQLKNFNAADQYLVNCHITSSTFKAMSSAKATQVLAKLLSFQKLASFKSSFITNYFCQCAPSVTYEGDNSVLYQQTAKHLMMNQSASSSNKVVPLKRFASKNIQAVYDCLSWVVSKQVQRLKLLFQVQMQKGKSFNTFWNQSYQTQLILLAKLWGAKACVNGIIIQLKQKVQNQNLRLFLSKISQVFISVILRQDCSVVQIYGFQIDFTNPLEIFSQEEFNCLINPQKPFQRKSQDNQFSRFYMPGKSHEWAKPRL